MTAAVRLDALSWAESMFAEFVRNANAVGELSRTAAGPAPEPTQELIVEVRPEEPSLAGAITPKVDLDDLPTKSDEPSYRILLLTRRKLPSAQELEASLRPAGVVRLPTPDERDEADLVVPRISEVPKVAPPIPERSEAGRIPSRELERALTDMEVLLRYGHDGDVDEVLTQVRSRFPEDLLLLRRLGEFYLSAQRPDRAVQYLFELAAALYQRNNIHGMEQALVQVLALEPQHPLATRLLSLLEARRQTL